MFMYYNPQEIPNPDLPTLFIEKVYNHVARVAERPSGGWVRGGLPPSRRRWFLKIRGGNDCLSCNLSVNVGPWGNIFSYILLENTERIPTHWEIFPICRAGNGIKITIYIYIFKFVMPFNMFNFIFQSNSNNCSFYSLSLWLRKFISQLCIPSKIPGFDQSWKHMHAHGMYLISSSNATY